MSTPRYRSHEVYVGRVDLPRLIRVGIVPPTLLERMANLSRPPKIWVGCGIIWEHWRQIVPIWAREAILTTSGGVGASWVALEDFPLTVEEVRAIARPGTIMEVVL